jgi:undecaprenyl phosphate N,N'-diacetylbacillosamine 1-phosphate transferase
MLDFSSKYIYERFVKRLLDIIISIIILIFSMPILVVAIILMMLLNKSFNVFFYQARPGKNEKIFKIVKLKTMNDNMNSNGVLLSDELRTTIIGKFLRKSSIDELPQLFNVIKGDMSLIGPRPLLVEYLNHYTIEQKRRHEVLPGITGWAQIHGRNSLKFEDRFKMDVWYVDNISFFLDCKIFYKTIIKIVKSDNVLIQDPNSIHDK